MNKEIQTKLQELFANYTKNLPEKIQALQFHWEELREQFSPERLQNFHRQVHSLCGSSATYGYAVLSKGCRELETYLKSLLDEKELTEEQKITIDRYIVDVLALVLTREDPAFSPSENEVSANKLVYILDKDKNFMQELGKEIVHAGYEYKELKDFPELLTLISTHPPAALIVDAEFLNQTQTKKLLAVQKDNNISVPLFCTADSGDLLTRLRSIRAESVAFLLKPIDTFYLVKSLDQACGDSTAEPFRILIVDDSVSLADYYSLVLKNAGMVARTVSDPLKVIDSIVEFHPDLLLLDIYMPDCSGIELAKVLRQEPAYTHIPIIFLSSEEDKYKQLKALSLGGDDFLTKPILPQHLVTAVRSRAKRAGVLSSYIIRDSLTGLYNHSSIFHQLDVEISRAERYKLQLTFVMLDIDHFKMINDQYGHLMGDRVLRKLSEILVSRLRKTDYVGRYGGEEFAIIMPNTDIETSKKLMDLLREKFAQHVFRAEDGSEFSVTFSAGIASYSGQKKNDELIELADRALYQAKHEGRNLVVTFRFP